MGGQLVASNENRSALEDLEWLGIEPDAMVSRPKEDRYQSVESTGGERPGISVLLWRIGKP